MKTKVIATVLATAVLATSIIGCGNAEVQNGDSSQTAVTEATQETASTTDSTQDATASTETEQKATASFEELISSLHAGQSYAYAPVCEGENALLVTSYTFDDLEGHQGTYEASIYIQKDGSVERVTTVQSGGTAYPIAVTSDNSLLLCMRNSVQKAHIDKASGEYVVTEESIVNYSAAEDEGYHNYANGTAEVATESTLFDKLIDEYYASEVLSFEHAGVAEDGTPHLAGGVYSAYRGEDLYNVAFYMAFNDETSGYTQSPDGMTGLPFEYEVKGEDIVFHIASADDTTEAKFGYENASFPTLSFKGENTLGADLVTLTCIGCADPETFDPLKYYDNDNNLYMVVKSFDNKSITGDIYCKEKIKKEYVENAKEGDFIYSVNGSQFKVVSFEEVNKAIEYGTDEEFKSDSVGISRFSDYLIYSPDDDFYYALEKSDYDDLYQVVAMMHDEDIRKLIEENVTFKLKEDCEITLQKFVSDGEFMQLASEFMTAREFKGDNYPQWSATAEEYYMTNDMLVAIGVIDGEVYNLDQVYVP